jgi:ribulose-5-phosphate 4-epimerase/fuculose-1-phosphate aldolase
METHELAADVATACRILAAQGHEHTVLGHVSARAPGATAMQVKPAGMGLAEVRPEDLLTIGIDGSLLEGTRPVHAEMPIHTGIYQRRPDVNAVVHTHPLHVAALAASAADFRMVNQDSVYFAEGIGFYPSPALIVTAEQGAALAEALGDRRAAVLRNHGLVTVGATVQEAVFLAVSFVHSLQVQVMATQFGALSCISADEAEEMARHFAGSYERRVNTAWEYHRRILPTST